MTRRSSATAIRCCGGEVLRAGEHPLSVVRRPKQDTRTDTLELAL